MVWLDRRGDRGWFEGLRTVPCRGRPSATHEHARMARNAHALPVHLDASRAGDRAGQASGLGPGRRINGPTGVQGMLLAWSGVV
jgi:hypothetical protein